MKINFGKRDSHIQNYLISQNIDFNVITDLDLHYSGIPQSTKVLFLNSHPEYFSEKMYDEIDTYLAQGGNLVNLGGNAIYWKVTLKENQMEVRKQRNAIIHSHDGSIGGQWRWLGRPESAILCGQYTSAGYDTYAHYEVKDSSHFLFQGTSLNNGDLLGEAYSSGHETDKMTPYSPSNCQILAKGLNPDQGAAEMTFYRHTGGGMVLSFGSLSLTTSIPVNQNIQKIIFNFINSALSVQEK